MTVHYKINIQLRERKSTSHIIQHTVAQYGRGEGVVGRKNQMDRDLRREGLAWYLCHYVLNYSTIY